MIIVTTTCTLAYTVQYVYYWFIQGEHTLSPYGTYLQHFPYANVFSCIDAILHCNKLFLPCILVGLGNQEDHSIPVRENS